MIDKIFIVIFGLFIAVLVSWIPLLMYTITASVFTAIGSVTWAQSTFFTWIIIASYFLWGER